MKKLLQFTCKALGCPVAVHTLVILISITALGAAIASELFLGLEPCPLCIYQRWGFVAAALFSIIGLITRKKKAATSVLAGLSALSFLATSAVATYHTGVEQKWWVSAVEGCSAPASFLDNDNQSWIDNLMATPSGRCDEIPWQDPLIGLSMANYNILLCLGMFVICLIGACRIRKKIATARHA